MVNRFDWMASNFVWTIIAPRRSGKSFLIELCLESGMADLFDQIYILNPSMRFNQQYRGLNKFEHVHLIMEPDIAFVENLIHETERVKAETNGSLDFDSPKILLILDDLIDSGLFRFQGIIDRVAERGRHIGMSMICSSQRFTALSKSVRINSDYFTIFAPAAVVEMEKFTEQYVPREYVRPLRRRLVEVFNINKYNFIFLDATSTRWEEKLVYTEAHEFIENRFYDLDLRPEETMTRYREHADAIRSENAARRN
jgi:hypothetical protein